MIFQNLDFTTSGSAPPPPVLTSSSNVSDSDKAYIATKLRGLLKSGRKNNTKEIFDWIDVSRQTDRLTD